jgi:hypothetical protein
VLAAGRLFSILQPIQKFGLLPALGQQSRVRLKLSHQVGQKMYLSMTEQDYQGVRSEARLKTALVLGISNASDLRAPRKISALQCFCGDEKAANRAA